MNAHEETWVSEGGAHDGDIAIVINGRHQHIGYVVEPERFHIAVCAPEAIRMLLDAEWEAEVHVPAGMTEVACIWCCNPKADGHRDDCPWLALMRKAGVRE